MPVGSPWCSGLPFEHKLLTHPPGHDPVDGAPVGLFLCQGRVEKHNRAEHSFVQSWHLGWSATGAAVLLTAPLPGADTVLNLLLPLPLPFSLLLTSPLFFSSFLFCPSNMFPHFYQADLPMTHPAHVVIVYGSDAIQPVFKCLIIAQKLNN